MKREMNKLMIAMLFLGGFFFLIPATGSTAQKAWKAPANYKSKVNKYKTTKDVDKVGKALWKKHCASCHGNEGYGDGKKAGELDSKMREFSDSKVQAQTDGELYYKSFIGRDEMPNFEKKIPDQEDRWLLVNYLRKLK